MARQENEGKLRGIIYERMDILLSLAATALRQGKEAHARRYVYLARKLSTRYNCRMGPQQKMRFCKECGLPSILGFNTKVRLRKRARCAEYSCKCGAVRCFKY